MHQSAIAVAPQSPEAPHPAPRRTWPLILATLFFAAIIPETVVTLSTSPAKMLAMPIALPFIMLFYGPAVLLTRELIIRRRLRWGAIILLGLAFGILNEGVAAGTWYTMQPQGYAFLGPFDVTWIVALEVFHLFISIILNVAFVDVLFPHSIGQSLLGRRGMIAWGVFFLCFTGLVAFAPLYRAERLGAFAGALVLVALALLLPPAVPRAPAARPAPGLWRLRWAGFGVMALYFAIIYALPVIVASILTGATKIQRVDASVLVAQEIDILSWVAFAIFVVAQGRHYAHRADWAPRHTLALLSGPLAFGILFSLIFGWQVLEPLVTLPFAALLVVLAVRQPKNARAMP
jgi:hypothetical protein